MARWRWRSSTASSKERSSSKSKARLIAPRWSKAKKTPPERGSCQLPHSCAYRRPERNPTRGSLSTAELVPLFAATDSSQRNPQALNILDRFHIVAKVNEALDDV